MSENTIDTTYFKVQEIQSTLQNKNMKNTQERREETPEQRALRLKFKKLRMCRKIEAPVRKRAVGTCAIPLEALFGLGTLPHVEAPTKP